MVFNPLFANRKRKKRIPVRSRCRNCEAELIGRYCHRCGQDLFAGSNNSLGEIIYNSLDSIFAWDNKVFRTLKYLVFYPGKLTKEFIAGRVIRYVYPMKLFWFITLIFFAILSFSYLGEREKSREEAGKAASEKVEAKTEGIDAPPAEVVQEDSSFDSKIEEMVKRAEEKEGKGADQKVKEKLQEISPYSMLILIPFFAFLLQLFFRKHTGYYAGQVIFAFHFHAFTFLLFTLLIVLNYFLPQFEKQIDQAYFLIPAIYFIIALYVVYRPKIFSLLWKVPLIMFLYGITIVITGLLLLIIAALVLYWPR